MTKKDFQENKIAVKGARTHNLKNINVEMPRNKMVVITGVSGSESHHLLLTLFLPKGRGDMWNLCLLMLVNF